MVVVQNDYSVLLVCNDELQDWLDVFCNQLMQQIVDVEVWVECLVSMSDELDEKDQLFVSQQVMILWLLNQIVLLCEQLCQIIVVLCLQEQEIVEKESELVDVS